MAVIGAVMAAAAAAAGTGDDNKPEKRAGKGSGGRSRSGVLSALFGACLCPGGSGSGGDDDDEWGGRDKSGKLVLIEGEAGIGKTCLLKAVERSAAQQSGFWCFRTVFSTRQEVNYGGAVQVESS